MRSLAYRLHKMEPLLLFLPPVQGSRSIWQSGISLRSCSCCSIGAQQLPHRFPLSHELKAQTNTVVGMRLRTVCNINSTSHNVPHQSTIATNNRALEVYASKHCAYFFVSVFDKACVIHLFPLLHTIPIEGKKNALICFLPSIRAQMFRLMKLI